MKCDYLKKDICKGCYIPVHKGNKRSRRGKFTNLNCAVAWIEKKRASGTLSPELSERYLQSIREEAGREVVAYREDLPPPLIVDDVCVLEQCTEPPVAPPNETHIAPGTHKAPPRVVRVKDLVHANIKESVDELPETEQLPTFLARKRLPAGHCMPCMMDGSTLVLYPRLECDPKFVDSTEIKVTVHNIL